MTNILVLFPLDAPCSLSSWAISLMLTIGRGIWKEMNKMIFYGMVTLVISLAE